MVEHQLGKLTGRKPRVGSTPAPSALVLVRVTKEMPTAGAGTPNPVQQHPARSTPSPPPHGGGENPSEPTRISRFDSYLLRQGSHRGVALMVEQRTPNPKAGSSTLPTPATVR